MCMWYCIIYTDLLFCFVKLYKCLLSKCMFHYVSTKFNGSVRINIVLFCQTLLIIWYMKPVVAQPSPIFNFSYVINNIKNVALRVSLSCKGAFTSRSLGYHVVMLREYVPPVMITVIVVCQIYHVRVTLLQMNDNICCVCCYCCAWNYCTEAEKRWKSMHVGMWLDLEEKGIVKLNVPDKI